MVPEQWEIADGIKPREKRIGKNKHGKLGWQQAGKEVQMQAGRRQ